MNRFFVGQRVRHVRTVSGRVPVGAEGVIREIGTVITWAGPADCRVLWRGYEHLFASTATGFDQIEPILPEGAAPSEFTTLHDLLSSLEGVVA